MLPAFLKRCLPLLLGWLAWLPARAQPAALPTALPLSRQMADAFMRWYPDSVPPARNKAARWGYEHGLMLHALWQVGQQSREPRYGAYVTRTLNYSLPSDGSTILGYRAADYSLDNLNSGRVLLTLGRQPGPDQARYRRAAALLRQQLAQQPVTSEGGYWHKQRYPNQVWLDGLYMAEPFAAQYAQLLGQSADFDHVARQFALVEQRMADPRTGLLYHGYDVSRAERWASPATGCSPNFWGRGVGWYAMALVDVLDYFPAKHPQRATLVRALQRLAPVLTRYQDPASGCWYQVLDQGSRAGNYLEASASCMLAYALAKGARLGYLDRQYAAVARRAYAGIVRQFVQQEPDGTLALVGTVSVGGLGGSPYRDGSYEYYLSEPLKKNDFKGVGPFILASLELERQP